MCVYTCGSLFFLHANLEDKPHCANYAANSCKHRIRDLHMQTPQTYWTQKKYDAPNNLAIPNSCWSLQPTRANTETATHRIPTASPNQHAEAPPTIRTTRTYHRNRNTDTTRGIACCWIHLHVISIFFILPTWTHMFFLFPLTPLWIKIKTLTLEWY